MSCQRHILSSCLTLVSSLQPPAGSFYLKVNSLLEVVGEQAPFSITQILSLTLTNLRAKFRSLHFWKPGFPGVPVPRKGSLLQNQTPLPIGNLPLYPRPRRCTSTSLAEEEPS